ncbi:MAG TPA: hypothetical protein VMH86_10370 [Rhizomicrobium sp.]|nr:hypothetical protein [Rhizomicrobium sp.]
MENPSRARPRSRFVWVATAITFVGFVPVFLTGPCTLIFGIPGLIDEIGSFFSTGHFVDMEKWDWALGWGSISFAGLGIILAGHWLRRRLERR